MTTYPSKRISLLKKSKDICSDFVPYMRDFEQEDELTTSLIPVQIANNVSLLPQFASVGLGAKIVLN